MLGVGMCGEIVRMSPDERVQLDIVRLGSLFGTLEPSERQCAFEDAQVELRGLRLLILRSYMGQDFEGLDVSLIRLIRIAPALGLTMLARVGGDVRICLQRQDETGLAATWTRLQRLLVVAKPR